MSESRMYQYLRDKTAGVIHWERITERLRTGVADTVWVASASGVMGWCELKWLPQIRADKPWVLPDLRNDQILFLSKQRQMNSKAFVLLRVGKPDMWLLFDVPADPIKAVALLQAPSPSAAVAWDGWPGGRLLEQAFVLPEHIPSHKDSAAAVPRKR